MKTPDLGDLEGSAKDACDQRHIGGNSGAVAAVR